MKRAGVLLALCAALALQGRARAEPDSLYAPVPPDIEAVIASENDRALAKIAIESIEQRLDGATDIARAQLVILEDAGLQSVARHLAKGGVPARARPDLLHVIAASEHRGADLLLERAAGESRPLLRMIAADGLGRGRTPRAVPVLERLARDDVPAVRIAALRALFAIDTPQARAARVAVPPDDEAALLAARLRWHRRAEDAWPALVDIATSAYRRGRSAALRLAAADLLTLPRARAPLPLLLEVVREMGTNAIGARLARVARGVPRHGYDEVEMRRIAISAAFTLLERKDLPGEERKRLIARAVWWVARPVEMDPYRRDPIPEYRLRRRLPDLGAEIIQPVVRLLQAGRFIEPRSGVLLIRELGAEAALPVLRRLAAPPAAARSLESRADRGRRHALRAAAVGAIQDIGRIGDPALARALVLGDEHHALQTEAVQALAGDSGAWVVPLLSAARDREGLRSYALDQLERRSEPEARRLLIEDLFEHVHRPEDRMAPLVKSGDAKAFELLRRALEDERSLLRIAALTNIRHNPRLGGDEGRKLLESFRPSLQSDLQIQEYIYALLAVAPAKAVAYVREMWSRFEKNGTRQTSLRQLQQTRGKAARRAAIDLALEHAGPQQPTSMLLNVCAVLKGYWSYRREDVEAFWLRMLASPERALRWDAVRAFATPGGPDATEHLLPLLSRAMERKALGEESQHATEQAFAEDILKTLRHQPWEKVEAAIIDAALDTFAASGTRVAAAHLLMGRLSDSARGRLLAWLRETTVENTAVLYSIAKAVGHGASPAQAGELQALLKQTILAFYTNERLARLEGETLASIDADAPRGRVLALARAVAQSRHQPTVRGLLDLLFDVRFARYARASVDRERALLTSAGPDAAARTPSRIGDLAHQHPSSLRGMPSVLYDVAGQLKVLDDESLAAALDRVLKRARREGRLAHFPDLYLYRLRVAIGHPWTGRRPLSCQVIYDATRHLEETDSAIDYHIEAERVTELSIAGRFKEAVAAQERAVRILARRGHADRDPALWRMQQARLAALRGGLYASRGLAEEARASYRRAVLHAPNDPNVLNTVAWQRALAGFDLSQAEADAVRATNLEARVEIRPTVNSADTLAYVLLKLGRPVEALDVLAPLVDFNVKDGLILYHLAQMYAAAGRPREAGAALVAALTWDRALAGQIANDTYLKAFGEADRMKTLLRAAYESRRDKLLE